jgi:phospholipase/carboxylesterase
MALIRNGMVIFLILSSFIISSAQDTEIYIGSDLLEEPEEIDIYGVDTLEVLKKDLDDYRLKAIEYYLAGDYEKACQYYLYIIRKDVIDSTSIYNLACSYALLGEAELSAEYLKRAVIVGFDNLELMVSDPDFDRVRDEKVFEKVMKSMSYHLKRKREERGRVIYVESDALMECRVHLPSGYNPVKSYPLLIALHGQTGNPDNFVSTWYAFDEPEFIFATPQGPFPVVIDRYLGYKWGIIIPEDMQNDIDVVKIAEDYVIEVVDTLKSEYKITEVYLMGFSAGAMMTYIAGIKNPEDFAGIICFGGYLNEEYLSDELFENGRNLRVFIGHGKNDLEIDFKEAERAREILTDYGYDVTFISFDGGHMIPDEILYKLVNWMENSEIIKDE